ncbi:hypothetical protein THER_0480 [Thermodesulfovibrio sp. N1]|nr:hypothetical protein THER_0480 [Thermodesulfovibrio sp. N1]
MHCREIKIKVKEKPKQRKINQREQNLVLIKWMIKNIKSIFL